MERAAKLAAGLAELARQKIAGMHWAFAKKLQV